MLSYAFRADADDTIALFGIALGLTVLLVILQRAALWVLARVGAPRPVGR